jgi:3-isopropylmalate dehydratase large subunit
MGTLVEEIFSYKLGRPVQQGELVVVEPDLVMSHDTTTPLAIEAFAQLAVRVKYPERVAIVFDHVVPPANVDIATLQKRSRTFAREQGIEIIQEGVCHQVLPEKGLVRPGMVVIGADSHTCTYGAIGAFSTGMGSTDIGIAYATGETWFRVPETIMFRAEGRFNKGVYAKDLILNIIGRIGVDGATYKSCEFAGSAISAMSVGERLTLSNMAIEMGGKAGLIEPDETTERFVRERTSEPFYMAKVNDPQYEQELDFDVSQLGPQIACPPDVGNVRPVEEVEGTELDEVFIGTCTNGRLDDLAIAASILAGKRVSKNTRTIIVPASNSIYLEAMERGYIRTFMEAGAVVGNPGCGPCLGRHQGVLAEGETALTTMNRNFTGRMGSPKANIYLSSPATAAVSAIEGRITDPRRVLND